MDNTPLCAVDFFGMTKLLTMESQTLRAEKQAQRQATELVEHFALCENMLAPVDKVQAIMRLYMIGYHHGAVDAINRELSTYATLRK